MINIFICDDDKRLCEQLHAMLLEIADTEVGAIRTFTSGEQLLFFLEERKTPPDLIFLDIRLLENSGIEIAKKVLHLSPSAQIIFISAYDTYYIDVYDVDHIYFLKKPIDKTRLAAALARAKAEIEKEKNDYFSFSSQKGIWRLPFRSILYFEKSKRQILIHTRNISSPKNSNTEEVQKFYGKFADILPVLDERFIHCHNSYLVNLSWIDKIQAKQIYLENGVILPISRSHYDATCEAYSQYLEKQLPCIF